MSTSIGSVNDYSYLFSNLNSSTSGKTSFSAGINYADYASLKNGSYLKLTKAYYEKEGTKNGLDKEETGDSERTLTTIQGDAKNLSTAADTLIATGSKSLFTKKEIVETGIDGQETKSNEYDMNAIYKGVSDFVKEYNSLVESGGESDTKKILRNTLSMTTLTSAHAGMLSTVGITVNGDNTLKVDEESFRSGDVTTMKSLFQGSGSYAYSVGAYASQVGYYAAAEANKSSTYSIEGSFGQTGSSGSLFDQYL